MTADIEQRTRAAFLAYFGVEAQLVASAPGRVNLLGEHTDYNDGHVLPVAIPQRTAVALRATGPAGPAATVTLHADNLAQTQSFDLQQPAAELFARYVQGCLVQARDAGIAVPSLQLLVQSDVPMGVGLSSSAALEVATLRALRDWLRLQGQPDAGPDDVRIAQWAQAAEIRHVGVRCGIMDQMASSLADTRHALWLDTRSLACRRIPLPAGTELLVLDSGIARSLAASGYNTRRAECEAAAAMLGAASLRNVDDVASAERLPEPLNRRVRHVLSENARVLRAVEGLPAAEFGALMNASHASLRDDYEVSVPALDALVALLRQQPGVFGARLTGAGFGGACVALCAAGSAVAVADAVLPRYALQGGSGQRLVPPQTPASVV